MGQSKGSSQNKGTFLTCNFFFLQIIVHRSRQMGYISFLLTEETEELRTEACHHCPECTEILTALAEKMSKAGSENKIKIGHTSNCLC